MKVKIFALLFLILGLGRFVNAQEGKEAKQLEEQRIREEQREKQIQAREQERIQREKERTQREQNRAAGKQQIYCQVIEETELSTGKVTVKVKMGVDDIMKEIRERDLLDEKTKKEVTFTNYLDALSYLSSKKWAVSSTTAYKIDKTLVRECLMDKPLPILHSTTDTLPEE